MTLPTDRADGQHRSIVGAQKRDHHWVSSGRNRPCPLCGRDTDDKCRWHSGVIACHQGDTFSPPPGLKRGDVLQLEGRRWAVVAFDGGFSGNALILRPHLSRKDFSPRQRAARQRVEAALQPTIAELFKRCRRAVQACLAMPELEHLTPAELRAEWAHARATLTNLQALRGPLLAARRQTPEAGRWLQAVTIWLRLVGWQVADLARFSRYALGTPTTQEIEALRLEVAL